MDEKQARALIEGVAGALPETSVDTARLVARGRGRQRRRVGVVTTVAAVVTVAVGGVAIAQVSGGDAQRDATIADQSSTPSTTAHVYLQDGWEPGSRNGGMSQCLHPTSLRKVAVEVPGSDDPAVEALTALMGADPAATHEGLDPKWTPVGSFSRQDEQTHEIAAVTHEDGVVTVDFAPNPVGHSPLSDPWPTASLACMVDGAMAMQQIVWTAQDALDTDDPVRLTAGGEPVPYLWSERLVGPVTADDVPIETR